MKDCVQLIAWLFAVRRLFKKDIIVHLFYIKCMLKVCLIQILKFKTCSRQAFAAIINLKKLASQLAAKIESIWNEFFVFDQSVCSECNVSNQVLSLGILAGLRNCVSKIRGASVFLDGCVLDPVVDLWYEDDFIEDGTNGEQQRDCEKNPPQPWSEEVWVIGNDKHVCNANPVQEEWTTKRDSYGVPENSTNVWRVKERSADPCNESWPPDALHQVCVEPKGRPWCNKFNENQVEDQWDNSLASSNNCVPKYCFLISKLWTKAFNSCTNTTSVKLGRVISWALWSTALCQNLNCFNDVLHINDYSKRVEWPL